MLELFREDLVKQAEGSPCYTDSSDSPMTFYVARIGTKEAKEQIKTISERLYGVFPRPHEIDEDEVLAHWLAYYGVLNWENLVDDENGEEQAFCEIFRRKLFLNKNYWLSLNRVLIAHANNFENYLSESAYKDTESLKKK